MKKIEESVSFAGLACLLTGSSLLARDRDLALSIKHEPGSMHVTLDDSRSSSSSSSSIDDNNDKCNGNFYFDFGRFELCEKRRKRESVDFSVCFALVLRSFRFKEERKIRRRTRWPPSFLSLSLLVNVYF